VIRVRGLRKEYPGGIRALDGVDLEIAAGEFVALIGPSAAGKSTLLRCLNGLIAPSAGEVVVDGETVTGASGDRLRRIRARVGFVFQQFNLQRRLSVLENVLVGRLAHTVHWRSLLPWFPAADVARARAALGRVGLSGLEDRRVDLLSGGQQQRVAIARALVQEPRIILADEPMSSLDPALARTVMELLRQFNQEDDITVITSLHVLELAQDYGRRIIGLQNGRVVHDGPGGSLTPDVANRIFTSGGELGGRPGGVGSAR
jgi:phosphonate transport system ATP-binding protein